MRWAIIEFKCAAIFTKFLKRGVFCFFLLLYLVEKSKISFTLNNRLFTVAALHRKDTKKIIFFCAHNLSKFILDQKAPPIGLLTIDCITSFRHKNQINLLPTVSKSMLVLIEKKISLFG